MPLSQRAHAPREVSARLAASAGAVLAVALLLAACQAPPARAALPDGVTVSVYQPRPDVAVSRIAIQVHNDGAVPVTVTAASLDSAFFGTPFVWGPDRTATVQPGYAVDLRVGIPADAVCGDVGDDQAVTLSWTTEQGTGTSTVAPDDPFAIFELLHDAACLDDAVSSIAAVEATTLEVPAALPAPAELVLSVEPTGADGTVTIDSVRSTTLLDPAGDGGLGVDELPLDIAISADGPREIRIPLVPNRCDAHALAEDKIGTRMPLFVTAADGTTGRLVLSASDELRAQMYAFYSVYCGL